MNILIVKDDRMLLKASSNGLTNAGHIVYSAENGNIASEIIDNNKIDLVICDLLMPVLDGATFLYLLKDYYSLSIPVIVTSSLNYGDLILKKNHIDFTVFMQKPFMIQELIFMVAQLDSKHNNAETDDDIN